MDINDPHTAAPAHWALIQEQGFDFEVAAAVVSSDTQMRQCQEDWLLFSYRLQSGHSTLCNHGRMHPRWTSPSNRKLGRGMVRRDVESQLDLSLSLPPVVYTEDPTAAEWLRLKWSQWIDLRSGESTVPTGSGVYRLSDGTDPIYLGESINLRARLLSHARRLTSATLHASCARMVNPTKVELRERETDLIGAFIQATGTPPRYQYLPTKSRSSPQVT